jgi:hypothetical protein
VQAQAQCIDGFIEAPAAEPDRREELSVPEGAFPVRSSGAGGTYAPTSTPAPAPASAPPSADIAAEPRSAGAPVGFTAALLSTSAPLSLRSEVYRFGVGVGLAALYGVALGAREGGVSLFKHALGAPAAMVAVAGLGVPALTIVLTLFNAPVEPSRVLAASSRAAASTGLVLGGFAPAAALFVTTSASSATAAVLGALGLIIAGSIGLRRLLGDLWTAISRTDDVATRSAAFAAFLGFTVFAVALAARVWWVALPILKGGLS